MSTSFAFVRTCIDLHECDHIRIRVVIMLRWKAIDIVVGGIAFVLLEMAKMQVGKGFLLQVLLLCIRHCPRNSEIGTACEHTF